MKKKSLILKQNSPKQKQSQPRILRKQNQISKQNCEKLSEMGFQSTYDACFLNCILTTKRIHLNCLMIQLMNDPVIPIKRLENIQLSLKELDQARVIELKRLSVCILVNKRILVTPHLTAFSKTSLSSELKTKSLSKLMNADELNRRFCTAICTMQRRKIEKESMQLRISDFQKDYMLKKSILKIKSIPTKLKKYFTQNNPYRRNSFVFTLNNIENKDGGTEYINFLCICMTDLVRCKKKAFKRAVYLTKKAYCFKFDHSCYELILDIANILISMMKDSWIHELNRISSVSDSFSSDLTPLSNELNAFLK